MRGSGYHRARDASRSANAGDGGELTRKQAAARLGVAETSVRRLEGIHLHPIRRGRFVYFDAQEVERCASEGTRCQPDSGEIAARAFELFRSGRDFRDVVIELRQTPDRVRQLYREYALGSDLLVPAAVRVAIEELGLGDEGRPMDAGSILRVLRNLAEGNRRLVQRTIDQAQTIESLRRAVGGAMESNHPGHSDRPTTPEPADTIDTRLVQVDDGVPPTTTPPESCV